MLVILNMYNIKFQNFYFSIINFKISYAFHLIIFYSLQSDISLISEQFREVHFKCEDISFKELYFLLLFKLYFRGCRWDVWGCILFLKSLVLCDQYLVILYKWFEFGAILISSHLEQITYMYICVCPFKSKNSMFTKFCFLITKVTTLNLLVKWWICLLFL